MLRSPWAILALIGILIPPGFLAAEDPNINPDFPVTERSISPPSVGKPIHECARAVFAEGFINKALIRVFADGIEVGKGSSKLGYGDISLTRPLRLGETISATQTVGPVTSGASDPVVVERYPKLTTPVVTTDVYACGRIVRVENLVASTHVEVSDLDAGSGVIGTAENTGTVASVFTSPLVQGHRLRAVQISCPDAPNRNPSPNSASVRVKASPVPQPPAPSVEKGLVETVEVLFAKGLFPGAEIEVKANNDVISSGYFANYPENWFPLARPIPPGHPRITARQRLCGARPQTQSSRRWI